MRTGIALVLMLIGLSLLVAGFGNLAVLFALGGWTIEVPR